jgi:hypothetical protein
MTHPGGLFWPIFPLLGWRIGLFFHGWDVYSGGPTEDQVREEMARLSRREPPSEKLAELVAATG